MINLTAPLMFQNLHQIFVFLLTIRQSLLNPPFFLNTIYVICFIFQFPGALKKQPEWGPILDEDRENDPYHRYEPLKREFSNIALSHNGSEKGHDNIAYTGHGNVKYIPNDDQTRM